MDKSLQGRIVLVTGASRGIGRATAIELAGGGAMVYVNYLSNEAAAKETLETIASGGGAAKPLPFDVADEAAVGNAVKTIIEESGKIDILVNNAGITRDGLLMRMKSDDWDAVLNVSLKGAFLLTRAVIRPMVKGRFGRIVNITSVVAQSGREGQANYTAAKAGIIGLTKSTARELAGKNITCNAVAPGFIETDLTAGMTDETRKYVGNMIPMNRFGAPREVAAAVKWLASNDASYITGAVIPVNGGLYM